MADVFIVFFEIYWKALERSLSLPLSLSQWFQQESSPDKIYANLSFKPLFSSTPYFSIALEQLLDLKLLVKFEIVC